MSLARVIRRFALLVPLALARLANATENPETSDERTLSPYFFVEGEDSGTDRLPLLGTDVTVHVAGVIADVTVRQTYKNDGTRPIHARYVFPASTRAAVHGLTMTLGDQVVVAKIQERGEAKKQFAAAKKAGKNAALLEQQRPNVFTMDLANIVPGQRIDVELQYTELLVPTSGVYEFVYPTVVGPRYSSTPEANAAESDHWIQAPYTNERQAPRYSLRLTGTIAAGMPIRELGSPSHAIRAEWSDSSRATFALAPAESEEANRDFVLRYRLEGDRIQSGLMLSRGTDENFFLMMIQPPRRVTIDQVPPREYVFVLDVSGSMNGYPLDTAKALMRDLLGHLRPTDTFDVLTFAGVSKLWAPHPMPATPANVQGALEILNGLDAGGGTELLAALKRAMELPSEGGPRSRSVIVVTDGYIAAEKEVFGYIRAHLGQANVFAFGIGTGVNRYLIEGVAKAGMGEPFVITGPAEARANATRFRAYIQYPLLTDVHVTYDGFQAYDVEPAALPDVMAERPILVQGKWRGDPRGRVVVTGVGGSGPFAQTFDASQVAVDGSDHALRALWARERIARLSDWSGEGESEDEKRQIVQLGLTYSLLTRYTSFIAVHEVIRNPSGAGENVTQALPLPAGVSNLAVGGGMGVGAEPGLGWLALLAAALAGTVAMRRRALPRASR